MTGKRWKVTARKNTSTNAVRKLGDDSMADEMAAVALSIQPPCR